MGERKGMGSVCVCVCVCVCGVRAGGERGERRGGGRETGCEGKERVKGGGKEWGREGVEGRNDGAVKYEKIK